MGAELQNCCRLSVLQIGDRLAVLVDIMIKSMILNNLIVLDIIFLLVTLV